MTNQNPTILDHFVWVKSEREAADFESLGWHKAEHTQSHHNHHSKFLMKIECEGDPPLPKGGE